ncbi:hypothetical protein ACJ4V0_19375 [Phreatobacter sp. HK31-P]
MFLIVVAIVVFGALAYLAPQSTDPAEVLRLAGQLCGTLAGVGIVLVVVDRLRRRNG